MMDLPSSAKMGYLIGDSQLKLVTPDRLKLNSKFLSTLTYSMPGAVLYSGHWKCMADIVRRLNLPVADFAVVYIGGNDLDNGKSCQAVVQDLVLFGRWLAEHLTRDRKVFLCTLAPRSGTASDGTPHMTRHNQFNAALMQAVSKHSSLMYIDVWNAMTNRNGDVLEGMLSPRDGYHIHRFKGIKRLCSVIRETLERYYRVQEMSIIVCSKCNLSGHSHSECLSGFGREMSEMPRSLTRPSLFAPMSLYTRPMLPSGAELSSMPLAYSGDAAPRSVSPVYLFTACTQSASSNFSYGMTQSGVSEKQKTHIKFVSESEKVTGNNSAEQKVIVERVGGFSTAGQMVFPKSVEDGSAERDFNAQFDNVAHTAAAPPAAYSKDCEGADAYENWRSDIRSNSALENETNFVVDSERLVAQYGYESVSSDSSIASVVTQGDCSDPENWYLYGDTEDKAKTSEEISDRVSDSPRDSHFASKRLLHSPPSTSGPEKEKVFRL